MLTMELGWVDRILSGTGSYDCSSIVHFRRHHLWEIRKVVLVASREVTELGLSSGKSSVGCRTCSCRCSGRVLLLDHGGAFPGRGRPCSLFRMKLLGFCGVERVGIRSGDSLFPGGAVEWLGRRRNLWCNISVLESQFTAVVVVGGGKRFDSRVVRRLVDCCTMRSGWGTPIGGYNT